MDNRRSAARKPLDVYFNKFLEGYPYLCRTVDLSQTGVLVETYAEPELSEEEFTLELRLPGDPDTLWVWAKKVRTQGRQHALEFISASEAVQQRIASFVAASN